MKSFNVPQEYRSPLITAIKQGRKAADKMKKDFSPTRLKAGNLEIILARHFGFCYGVENAIEIAFRAVSENPGKRIFLLSEMIHNPGVNADLQALGVRFLMDTKGNRILDWSSLTAEDIVIIPAFGTTLEMEEILRNMGIEPTLYETTCPFVEKVWNRAGKIGKEGYTVVVHGKPAHEETRATFSHSRDNAPTVVVNDMEEAKLLASYVKAEKNAGSFYKDFEGQYSVGFDPEINLQRIGVVNQTTMLAAETQDIADFLKQSMMQHYQLNEANIGERFADTRDTLCYATSENQGAVAGMLAEEAHFALVIGGYNSSNTSHLVELCEKVLPTYFISHQDCLETDTIIKHYDFHQKIEKTTTGYLPQAKPLKVMITSGASCPDALVEKVIIRLAALTDNTEALAQNTIEWVAAAE